VTVSTFKAEDKEQVLRATPDYAMLYHDLQI